MRDLLKEEWEKAKASKNEFLNNEPSIICSNLEELKQKYPSVNIQEIIDKQLKYWNKKPFQEKTKLIHNSLIKDFIELTNKNYNEDAKKIGQAVVDSINKYGIQEDGKLYIDSGLQKMRVGDIKKDLSQTEKINLKLEKIARLKDNLEIEEKLKNIKKETGYSINILRDKIKKIKKEFSKEIRDYSELPCEIDPRFYEEELLIHISKELDKDHIYDDREKLGTFLVGVSSELPNPKDHVSVAHKGDSSAGKTNLQLSVIKHFPSEENGIATRITPSEMEDRIQNWKRLVVTEINKHREGANTEIVETFKSIMEDGIRIYKKDNITGEPKEINVPQKTGFYATTEWETDDELETRYVVINIKGNENKNRSVVNDTLFKVSDINSILKKLNENESWISQSIRGLDSSLDVVIPFAKEINRKFETEQGIKELFDFSKERVKRDVKRLMSLTKAISWLYQKRRLIIDDKIIVAEPTDFITALKIFIPFFNVSYSGLDPRIEDVLNKIKNLEGKHNQEITKEFGELSPLRYHVIRSELQKEVGVSLNTLKEYIKKLKDKSLIDTYWEKSRPRFYMVRPIKRPISHLLDPITLQVMIGHLQAYCQVENEENIYKKYKKDKFDTIPLVKNIEYTPSFSKLTGVKLTGGNSEGEGNIKNEEVPQEEEVEYPND